MDSKIERIKKISKAVFVGLIILAILLLVTIIFNIVQYAGQKVEEPVYDFIRMFAYRVLLLAVIFVATRIFCRIEKTGTPFLPVVAKSMKTLALLFAFFFAVPEWLYQIVRVDRGLIIFHGNTFFALLCGGIVFCFATVFEYGCLLQTENDETL